MLPTRLDDVAPWAFAGFTRGARVRVELASHARRASCGRARVARVTRSSPPQTCCTRKQIQRLHDSHPWLQVDAHEGQVHVEQPQLPHLAAQAQEPAAQPQVEEQEQAMLEAVEESWLPGVTRTGKVC